MPSGDLEPQRNTQHSARALEFERYGNAYKLTHYLFRFPAKFHPPVARCLIDRYSATNDLILDPFCGAGTLLVEALTTGRPAIGMDIDPVAVFVSRVKTKPIDPLLLTSEYQRLRSRLSQLRRSSLEYDELMCNDLAPDALETFAERNLLPGIPNIHHWFRVYVMIDLAQIKAAITDLDAKPAVRDFFLACFLSIIRNASNADPVPVSGLEVTAHMKRREARGRRIDPFALYERRVTRELLGMKQLWEHAQRVSIRVCRADAASFSNRLRSRQADVVITSPPYNTAVDYYRRHTLEMYWLGAVDTPEQRIALAQNYIGRVQVRVANRRLRDKFTSNHIEGLIRHARSLGPARERAVVHYCASMKRALIQVSRALKPKGKAVFVVGNSKWNGKRASAVELIKELASDRFRTLDVLSYTSRNRYMSYSRRNGANVNEEYVLVLQKYC